MASEINQSEVLLGECEPLINEIFARCHETAPNFGVSRQSFKESLEKTARKFCFVSELNLPGLAETREFLDAIHHDDLFLAVACASGDERAWWEFDQQHRAYLERVARHLASTEIDAQEVIDTVYVELYGTRVVDGARVSKFASYSGRGSLRGWLRTVIWHSLVDLHRAGHDEISLDEMTETVGEGAAHANFAEPEKQGGEDEMLDQITHNRYRRATLAAIENTFAALDDHEKLLLIYYHVENLKLREIARMVEVPDSALRGWFKRKSAVRDKNPKTRIYESTIMRWLEKLYAKISQDFRIELTEKHDLRDEEVEICVELATRDLASPNIYRNLMTAK